MGALGVTGRDKARIPFEPLVPSTTFVPFGDAEAAAAAIDSETAAMIIEPVQGEGGIHVPPLGYLAKLPEARTKKLQETLAKLGSTSVLFIGGRVVDDNLKRAARNLPHVDVLPVQGANVYDILRRETLVITKDAAAELEARLK